MLKDENLDDLLPIIRVTEAINDLNREDPHVWAIKYVIDMWSQKFPERELYIEDLASNWSYKIPLEDILERFILIGIFEIKQLEIGKAISPEPLLNKLLEKYSSSREFFFQAVVKAVTGLAIEFTLLLQKNNIQKIKEYLYEFNSHFGKAFVATLLMAEYQIEEAKKVWASQDSV
jgi:hypothetical protein